MKNNRKIMKEIISEGYLKAILYDEGVIEIIWDPSIEIIEAAHLSKMQQIVKELGGGEKMLLLFVPHDFLHLSKEGAKYATSEEGTKYSLAIAVLVDNLAKKLLMNFFLRINKPKTPTKGCSTKEEAFNWLKKVREGTGTMKIKNLV